MLRIIQNRSPESAKSYYSRADYYGEGQEKAGVWGGKTAHMLGLSGRISECDFQALCDNKHPVTQLQLTARHNHDRTVGYDFNWHVPKGVSLAYAIGGDQRIEHLFERSVQETMEEIEAESQTRVRTNGRQSNRVSGNLAWGQFIHTTARPNDEGQVCPHLHAHCFVFNVTHDGAEDRYKAVNFRDLKRDAPYFEAQMHARLAGYLRDIGYSIRRDGRFWDIDGIPDDLKQRFSERTREIEALAEERNINSAEEKAKLGATTRNSKTSKASFPELQTEWRGWLRAGEADLFNHLRAPNGRGQVNGPQSTPEAVAKAMAHVFERDAVVPERRFLTEAIRFGIGSINVDNVRNEARNQGLITRKIEGRWLATTPDVLNDEASVLRFARESRNAVEPLNPDWECQEDWLSQEQRHAIDQLTHSRDRLQMLLGGAGTGKTTLMQQAVAAIKAGGHKVFTFAPSAEASRKVLRDEGFSSATTIAELLINEKLQNQLDENSVIWVDEASLLGSRQLKQVIDLAERKNTRIILSGDWKRQHSSVERGGILGLIDRYTGISPIQINTIRRQQGRYKEAIAAMADGDLLRGFDQLDALGWVHELDDDIRDEQIAKEYVDLIRKKQSTLIVSPTHREADHLTEATRNELRSHGLIGKHDQIVTALKPRHLTEGERANPAYLQPGDVVIFHQNSRGYRKGERVTITDHVPTALTMNAKRYAVYRPMQMPLAVGDRIRMTAGGRTKDGQHRFNNGSIFDVREIQPNGDIKLTNGWTIDRQFGHFQQGYVTTSHSSQGRTVDHVLIAESAESFPAGNAQQFYVSASRGRKSVHVFTDRKDELREIIQQSSTKTTASELLSHGHIACHQKQQRVVTQPGIQNRTTEFAYGR